MRILLVDDDPFIADALTEQNYVVDMTTTGETGWEFIKVFPYNLILLSMRLPRINSIHFCRQLRREQYPMPAMLLSDHFKMREKIDGLDAGADDYVVKPFEFQELLARIRALLRRGSTMLPPILEWNSVCLDSNRCYVTYKNQPLDLTPKEYRLLELFLRSNTRVFTRSDILEHLWSFDDPPGEDAVKTHIKRLRQKLNQVGAPRDFIQTVYGLGYCLRLNS